MSTQRPARLENSTIQPIALTERHGTATDLFTVWFATNFMLLALGAMDGIAAPQPGSTGGSSLARWAG